MFRLLLFIIASHPNAEVHLHCGSPEKIGAPVSSHSMLSHSISTPFDNGWSRLAFNSPMSPASPTAPVSTHGRMKSTHFNITTITTPRSYINTNSSEYIIHSNL